MDDARVRALLGESLALWNVDGSVDAAASPCVAVIRANGIAVHVERAPEDSPFRWLARWQARTRPCGSLVGVLSALRLALGVARGTPLRVKSGSGPNFEIPACEKSKMGPDPDLRVTVVTGFLGSGKTTLLQRLLRDPAMHRTAVIVNEFGEIGLDHDLIETSDESFVHLSNGCLCCRVRSDLVLTLNDLAARRQLGTLPPFERVVIETSGLADPTPIVHALATDRSLSELYALEQVVTTVDVLTGSTSLQKYAESVRQVALADTLVLTKTDLSHGPTTDLEQRLRVINPDARILRVVRGAIGAGQLLSADVALRVRTVPGARDEPVRYAFDNDSHVDHAAGIGSLCIALERPFHAVTLSLFLSALAENCGEDLLRMKGIVHVLEEPDHPAIVHGVQHVYHAPEWLERWPSADRRTRLVFIGCNLREAWVRAVLEVLDAEVAAQMVRRRSEIEPAGLDSRPAAGR